MTSLALVIPCKDEAKRLMTDAFLDALRNYPYLSFLFVDDGSTDDTAEVLALLERQSPAIHALYLPQNVGKAEAVRTGINWLLDNTEAEAVGFWDADLATPLSEIPTFVHALRGEAAIGSRWPHLGAQIDRNVFRHCTGSMMKTLIRLVLRLPVYDTQCGAKIFRRDLARRIFARPFLTRWLFDVELLKRIPSQLLRSSVAEVPLSFWRDVAGSKLGLRDSFRQLYDLARIALCREPEQSAVILMATRLLLSILLAMVSLSVFWSFSSGAATPQTSVRDGIIVVEVPRVKNMRDLASWATTDGHAIRRGRIYRSAALDYSREDWYKLNRSLPQASRDYLVDTLGIKTDVDLRENGDEVHNMTESPLGPEVKWVHVPSQSYERLGTEAGRTAFREVFRTFLDEANYPIIVHCRIGRDRTGTVAYILEALLGVSEDDLRRDWEYSERAKGNAKFNYGKFERLLSVFDPYPGQNQNEKVVEFVKSLGFSDADIAKFRSLMLEK